MNKTYLQCFFSLHLCPCLVVSFCKLRLKMINFPILFPVFFFLLTSQPLSSKVELFTSTLDHTPHLIITTISSVKPGRGVWRAICSKIPFRKISFRKVTKHKKRNEIGSESNEMSSKSNTISFEK